MSEAPVLRRRRRVSPLGCGLIAVGVLTLTIIATVAAIELFGSDTAGDGGARYINAGVAESFPRGEVQYLESAHIFVTRLEDGTFIALYDRAPKRQEPEADCRLRYDDAAGLNTISQLPGFVGGIVDECAGTRAVWRADGEFAFGAGFGHLDVFQTRIDADGSLLIDVARRTCTRSIGVPGVPPYEQRTCRGNR